jgi:hypothetical protein
MKAISDRPPSVSAALLRFHDHHDAARQPDHQRHTKKVLGPVDKGRRHLFLTHPRDQSDDDGHPEEQRPHPRHPPALAGHAPDHHGKGSEEQQQYQLLRAGQLGFNEFGIRIAEKNPAVRVALPGDNGAGRIGLHLRCISHDIGDADHQAAGQDDQPQRYALRERDRRRVGRDDGRKGIDGRAQRADARADQDNGDAGECVSVSSAMP